MADLEVENTLREIRERVLGEARARVPEPTAPVTLNSLPADAEPGVVGVAYASEPLARMDANLSTTGRAWSRLPPMLSYRRGAAARLELWLKRLIARATHWFTWEQVNFNSAVHHALGDARAAMGAHEQALARLRSDIRTEILTTLRAEADADRASVTELQARAQGILAQLAQAEARFESQGAQLRQAFAAGLERLAEAQRAAAAELREELGERLRAELCEELRVELRGELRGEVGARAESLHAETNARAAELQAELRERLDGLLEEQRVCFKQLSLEAGEAAVMHDRARRQLEARLETLSNMTDELYRRAGVEDLSEFYRTKFVSDEVLDARYFRALDRFDMRFARTMWVYDNVRAGSALLDLGCGAGMLALLKRKGVTLTGCDLSEECALASRRNGYDLTCAAELTKLPFADDSFDYVASLDVLGHVEFKDKDAVLSEIARVLRPGGVTLHGIECTDRRAQKSYEEMSEEELRRFVAVDGHVGLEEEQEHAARFRRFFREVAWEPRYALCLSAEEFVKQREEYGLPFEPDFVEYLRGLSHSERRAFDMAMGYVFGKISDLHVRLPKSGLYVLLKASDSPLGPFYNEHRDRSAFYSGAANTPPDTSDEVPRPRSLDRAASFDDGWYEPNMLPPVARWMKQRGTLAFQAHTLSKLRLDLTTHIPDVRERPLGLKLFLNGECLSDFSLFRHGWLELEIEVPDDVRADCDSTDGRCVLEIHADRTWQPRPDDAHNRDDRELSIAVCNIEALP